MSSEPNGRDPLMCEENGVPALHGYLRYHCRCAPCRNAGAEYYGTSTSESKPDPEAEAEAEKERLRREKLSEEIMEATLTTYEGGGRPREGAGIPDAAVRDVESVLEGDDG